MKKKIILGYIIGESILIITCIFVGIWYLRHDTYDYERFQNPRGFASYGSRIGYYRFNPETILSDLEQGKEDVFVPLSEDPFTNIDYKVDETEISWTQADLLKITSAVGQVAWNDPLDLNSWNIYSIRFEGSCEDTSTGYSSADVTYFRTISRNEKDFYETSLIEVDSHFGGVRWGRRTYPHSVGPWTGVDLSGDLISADDALRIAYENGGNKVSLQDDSYCMNTVRSAIEINDKWLVSYYANPSLNMYVDMETGMFEIIENNQPSFPTLVVPSDK